MIENLVFRCTHKNTRLDNENNDQVGQGDVCDVGLPQNVDWSQKYSRDVESDVAKAHDDGGVVQTLK